MATVRHNQGDLVGENRRERKQLVNRRDELVADLLRQARQSRETPKEAPMTAQPPEFDRHR